MPTLILMRHGQAGGGFSDHDRPLTAEGEQQALRRGRQLGAIGPIDQALVSDARRTRETYEAVSAAAQIGEVRFERDIYLGSWETILGLLEEVSGERILVVGHEPTISLTAAMLAETDDRVGEVRRGVRPSTAIVLELDRWTAPSATITDILIDG
ncbi:MAG: histidine phosphatase family protein [Flaviflexus sp.]|nr:histidine phosphatase family protein [Flaviflexus sp.]